MKVIFEFPKEGKNPVIVHRPNFIPRKGDFVTHGTDYLEVTKVIYDLDKAEVIVETNLPGSGNIRITEEHGLNAILK